MNIDRKTQRNLFIVSAILASLTLGVVFYIFDNIFIIMESAGAWSYKPIKRGFDPKTRSSDIRYGDQGFELLDIYKTNNKQAPVLVFIGSGFGQGTRKRNYRHIGMFGQREGMVVVIPAWAHANGFFTSMFQENNSYQTISGQARSINKSLKWIVKNISKYGGISRDINILTHGSGLAILARAISLKEFSYNQHVKSIASLSGIIDLSKMPQSHQKALDKKSKNILENFEFDELKNISFWFAVSEKDIPLVNKTGKQFIKFNLIKELVVLPVETHRSAIFRLGRHHHAGTTGLSDFWNISFSKK